MSDQTQANASTKAQDDAGIVLSTIANAVKELLTAFAIVLSTMPASS